ncbi:MAG: prolyl oligopeptidase family serine peptidase [Saprospiraceae bacterium]|nr:prolyl oligopeptidase family serine peptidase [Saprospiraceae bacterium]
MKLLKYSFMRFYLYLCLALIFSGNISLAQKHFKAGQMSRKDGSIVFYQELQPRKIKKNKKYPLVIFLHGAGERGNDNQKQLAHGGKLFDSRKMRRKFPAFVVFPQCPADDYWAKVDINRQDKEDPFRFDFRGKPTAALQSVFDLIQFYRTNEHVDPNRIYIMGLSMGGMGTIEAISRHPDWFAAAVSICGGGDLEFVQKFARQVPVWIFHGAMDDIVLPKYSRDMVQEIIFKGGFPKYTEYPEANHNSWDSAFKEKKLLPWLFEQRKKLE